MGFHDDGGVRHDGRRLQPETGRGKAEGRARQTGEPGCAACRASEGYCGGAQRRHRRLQQDQIRIRQDHRRAYGAPHGDHQRSRGRGRPSQRQSGRGPDRGLLQRARDPRHGVRRRVIGELRSAACAWRRHPGARHPYEQAAGDQRGQPDRPRPARHVRPRLRRRSQ